MSNKKELTACKVDLEGLASGLQDVIQAKRWRMNVLSTITPVPSGIGFPVR